jgi:putative tryptophan/tyrosine transport system substrate-binding protein
MKRYNGAAAKRGHSVITRRGLISGLSGCLIAITRAGEVLATGKVWQIGYLSPSRKRVEATLVEALRELGYVEGQTARFDVRSAENDLRRLPELAAVLVRMKVDLIVAVSQDAIRPASQATRTIPIVMDFWGQGQEKLVESGIIASFARPGANVTGVYMLAPELEAKRLELLLEALPNARKVAILNPGSDPGSGYFDNVRQVAQATNVELFMTDVPSAESYELVLEAVAKERADALLVPSFPRFSVERQRIVDATARRRIPAMYEWGDIARAGGLMAYGPVFAELQRLIARYVDRILKGANPSDLPVQQPRRFELVVNLKTAKALALTVPPSVLVRADEVVE